MEPTWSLVAILVLIGSAIGSIVLSIVQNIVGNLLTDPVRNQLAKGSIAMRSRRRKQLQGRLRLIELLQESPSRLIAFSFCVLFAILSFVVAGILVILTSSYANLLLTHYSSPPFLFFGVLSLDTFALIGVIFGMCCVALAVGLFMAFSTVFRDVLLYEKFKPEIEEQLKKFDG